MVEKGTLWKHFDARILWWLWMRHFSVAEAGVFFLEPYALFRNLLRTSSYFRGGVTRNSFASRGCGVSFAAHLVRESSSEPPLSTVWRESEPVEPVDLLAWHKQAQEQYAFWSDQLVIRVWVERWASPQAAFLPCPLPSNTL